MSAITAPQFGPPRHPRPVLRRPRLNRRLTDALDGALTVVSGPAGYGKSTLVADWLDELELPHTWLALDRSHRDPRVLVRDLTGAVQAAFPAAIARFARRVETARGETNPEMLVREFSAAVERGVADRFVFAIDDLHVLADSAAIEALDALIRHPPANVRLVLLTRAWDVVPELARRVSDGTAVALLESDLAFDDAEAARLLRRSRLRDARVIRMLARRADGWPAALALLAEHPRDASPDGANAAASFVLADFLDREVLAPLRPSQLALLELCGVLEVFAADVVHELSGGRRRSATLRELELHTQLIVRAGHSSTYRVHGILAQHLVARLERDAPERLLALRRAARAAYERRGDLRRATELALDAADWPAAAAAIAQLREELFQHGDWTRLSAWLDRLPEAVLQSNPDLALTRARVAMKLRDGHDGLLRLHRIAESTLDADHQALRAIYESVALRQLGRVTEAVDACRRARSLTHSNRTLSEHVVGELCLEEGIALGISGEFASARLQLEVATRHFEDLGDQHRTAEAYNALGLTTNSVGQFAQAMTYYARAAAISRRLDDIDFTRLILINIGDSERSTGRLDKARATFESIVALGDFAQLDFTSCFAVANLAEIAHDLGNLDRAISLLESIRSQAERFTDATLKASISHVLSLAYLEQGNFTAADRLCTSGSRASSDNGQDRHASWFLAALGASLTAQGRPADATPLLNSALEITRQLGALPEQGRVQLRRAHALLLLEDTDCADVALHEVGTIVDQIGYDEFLWVDARLAATAVIYAVSHGIAKDVFSRLLARSQGHRANASRPLEAEFSAHAMGGFRVQRIAHAAAIQWRSERSMEMLFYMLESNRPLRKEEIAVALWPEIGQDRLNSAFHSTLHRLRLAIGREHIAQDRGRYILSRRSAFRYDAEEFDKLIQSASRVPFDDPQRETLLLDAIGAYDGSFGHGSDSDWASEVRWRLERQYVVGLLQLADIAVGRRQWTAALDWAAQAARVDPTDEAALHAELVAYIGLRQPAAAMNAIRAYEARLGTGSSPSLRLQQLRTEIRTILSQAPV
ncbi:MAG: tetratricopeptide repeat protein [Dehalococcoidia bacterium]